QRFDAPDVDERAEIAQRGDRAADDRADAESRPGRGALCRGLCLEQLSPRDDDVAGPGVEPGDAEAEALSDVLRALDPPAVDLRSGAEGAHAPDLHLVAALVLPGDHAFDRDRMLERLLELAGNVPPTPGDFSQHDRPGPRPV